VSKITIAVGAFLIVLGLIGYFGTGMVSWTALIPALFGLPLTLLGLLALQEGWRKHAMHAAVIIGLVGFLGGAFSFVRPLLSGGEMKPMAAVMQALMALTCAAFVGLCVKSFIDARVARKQGASEE
jgi:uncharacterized membrane protein